MFEHPLFPHAMLPQIIWAMGLEEHRGTCKNPCAVSNLFWMSRPLHSSQMKWLFVCRHDGLGYFGFSNLGRLHAKVSSGDSCTRTHTHTANLQILACEERAHAVMAMLQSPVVGLAVVLPAFMKLECETVWNDVKCALQAVNQILCSNSSLLSELPKWDTHSSCRIINTLSVVRSKESSGTWPALATTPRPTPRHAWKLPAG